MVVYADILFLINFLMDMLSLYLCEKIVGAQIGFRRKILCGAVGGAFGVVAVVWNFSDIVTHVFSFLTAFAVVGIAFGQMKLISWCKKTVLFYFVSFLLGGVSSALMYMWHILPSFVYHPLQTFALYVGTFGSVLCLYRLLRRTLKRFAFRRDVLCDITYGGKTHRLTLLVDSGNMLIDPYFDLSVIMLSKNASRRVFGNTGIENLPEAERIRYAWHYIPIGSATGQTVISVCKADDIRVGRATLRALIAPTKQLTAGVDGIIAEACLTDINTNEIPKKEEQHEHFASNQTKTDDAVYR